MYSLNYYVIMYFESKKSEIVESETNSQHLLEFQWNPTCTATHSSLSVVELHVPFLFVSQKL